MGSQLYNDDGVTVIQTVVVGISEINIRRYFVGIWPDIETARKQLHPIYVIDPETVIGEPDHGYGTDPHDYNAIRTWGVGYNPDYDADSDENYDPNADVSTLGSDTDGFQLYEIDIANLPGFVGYDED